MLINTNDVLTKHRNTDTIRNYIEESVEFAFNFTKLPHPFKARWYGPEISHLSRSMDEFQRRRNVYFAKVLEECKKPSQAEQLRTIFCKMLHEMESVLVCEPLAISEEPTRRSWSVAEKIWKNIKDELKDYNPFNEAHFLSLI